MTWTSFNRAVESEWRTKGEIPVFKAEQEHGDVGPVGFEVVDITHRGNSSWYHRYRYLESGPEICKDLNILIGLVLPKRA